MPPTSTRTPTPWRHAQDPFGSGQLTATNLNSNWYVDLQPELHVSADAAGSLQVWDPRNVPPEPGTYPQGPSAPSTLLTNLAVVAEVCSIVSGVLTIVDLKYVWPDGSYPGHVTSLALWFDVTCDYAGRAGSNIRGCVRYSP